ncbi:MAG: hypothetical protein RLY87_2650, partial [Chloroflexota bacterium]
MSIQPVAQFVDIGNQELFTTTNSSAIEVSSDDALLFRWGYPGAAIQMPVLPSGDYLVTAVLSVPRTSAQVSMRLDEVPIGQFTAQPDQFRVYTILARVPATGWQSHTTLALDSTAQYDDGTRVLTVAYAAIAFVPTALPARVALTSTQLLVFVLVLASALLARSVATEGSTLVALLLVPLAFVWVVSQVSGVRTLWYLSGALVVLVAWLGHGVTRWWGNRQSPDAVTPRRGTTHAYRADIDGIRAIAVGVVVLFHAFPEQFPGGFIGVDVFFVISGYLISQILLERMADGSYSILDFYARRVRRIFPALIVVLLAVLYTAHLLLPRGLYESIGLQTAAGAGFVANLLYAAQAGYFDDASVRKPLLHVWSLGIEEQFYIVWPFVMLAISKSRRWAVPAFALIVGVSFAANLLTVGDPAGIAFYWPMMRVWQFACGAFLAYQSLNSGQTRMQVWWQRATASTTTRLLLGCVAVLALGVCTFFYDKNTPYPGWAALVPTIAAMVLLVGRPGDWVGQWFLATRPMVAIGVISYPLYLWHWPVLAFGYIVWDARFGMWERTSAVVLAVVLAVATYWVVEQPIRFGRLRRLHPLILGVALALIGAPAFIAVANGQTQPANAAYEQAEIPFVVNGSACGSAAFAAYEAKYCSFHSGTDAQVEPVYVVGDSHALYLARGFFSQPTTYTTYLRGVYGCVPLLGLETYVSTATTSNDCASGIDALYGSLDRADVTQHRTIVFAMRFTGLNETKLNPTDSHTIHIQAPGPRVPITPTQRIALYEQALARTMARLAAYPNTTVVVLYQVPELDFNPTMCALRINTADPCRSNRAVVDVYAAPYRALLGPILARHPTLRVVDPTELFCDAQWCTVRSGQ